MRMKAFFNHLNEKVMLSSFGWLCGMIVIDFLLFFEDKEIFGRFLSVFNCSQTKFVAIILVMFVFFLHFLLDRFFV